MVYDWENKEELCYRLYIEEKKSLEEIMDFLKEHHKFTPSKRAFQTQFKRWEFPSKQNPAHKNAELVQRVKELWERNVSQREMLRILNEEDGFDIKERELMRVRAKNRWLLRVPNGMKAKKRESSDADVIDQLQQALFDDGAGGHQQMDGGPEMDEGVNGHGNGTGGDTVDDRAASPELSPEVLAKRMERLQKLQAESATRWASRKRRRRTRGWAGLPADPPGPPRFPSETTIDESKAFLSLDSNMYRDIRARFQRICEEADVIKKTVAGPERWEAVKARLVQESPHLQQVFWQETDNQEQKKLALDVVCTDVTKRMRTLERRMTIAEAKNTLGINPEESRQIRNAFYQTLKADHFTSKLEAGDEHWRELKQQWIDGSVLLTNILAPGETDPQHQEKVKAMEVLCRDVMKRLRDDQTKRDPTRKKKFDTNFTPDVTSQSLDSFAAQQRQPEIQQYSIPQPHDALVQAAAHAQAQHEAQARAHMEAQQAQVLARHNQGHILLSDHDDMRIDPSLLLATASDPSLLDAHHDHHHSYAEQQYADTQYTASAAQQAAFSHQNPGAQVSSIAVYFRLHPASDIGIGGSTRLWVSTLSSVSVDELRSLATQKFPGTIPVRLEGIVKEEGVGAGAREMNLQIDCDEELDAYLAAINGVKPVFMVQLMQGWKNE